jgi:hypothetical protein
MIEQTDLAGSFPLRETFQGENLQASTLQIHAEALGNLNALDEQGKEF